MQLALGIVGGVIGSFFGMPQLGFMLGSALGGVVEARSQKIEGPRINDLKVQASQYGSMIPILFGTNRIAGNVIFCTNLREVSKSQRQGKGGGPKVTTYTYNVDIAILVSRGVMHGIRKSWANSKLIFDASSGADAGAVIASTLKAKSFKFYGGDETQMPDPTIEATVGVGRTPAYRGLCYVVFTELDCPNGQIPQMNFEVLQNGNEDVLNPVYAKVPNSIADDFQRATILEGGAFQWYAIGTQTEAPFYEVGPGYHSVRRLVSFRADEGSSQAVPIPVQGGPYALKEPRSLGVGDARSIWVFDLPLVAVRSIHYYTPGTSANEIIPKFAAWDSVTEEFALSCQAGQIGDRILILPSEVYCDGPLTNPGRPVAFYDGKVYTTDTVASVTALLVFNSTSGSLTETISATGNYGNRLLIHAGPAGVFVADGAAASIGSARSIYKVEDGEWKVMTNAAHFENANESVFTFFANNNYAVFGPANAAGDPTETMTYRVINYGAVEPDPVPLADIITDICAEAGLGPSSIDVTGVDDEVHGYPVTRVTSARGNLDPLVSGYFLDPVESDGKIKFLKRADQVVVATIAWEELATGEDGSEPGDPFPLSRMQEAELPRKWTVNFINKDQDYQTGAESSVRQIVDTINDVVDELPVATSSDHAASVASVKQYNAWSQRNRRSLTLPRKFAALDPADLVAVESPPGEWTVWRLTKVVDTGQRLECECEPADQQLFAMQTTGTSPTGGQTVDHLPGPTTLVLLDMPILRDEDSDAGLYAAMSGLGTGWRGAELFSGLTLDDMRSHGRVSNETVIGIAEGALADWDANLVDEVHVLTVQADLQDELYSITHAQLLSGEANVFALGVDDRWEILKYRDALDLGDGRWQLTGLLRGQRGTEWAAALHEVSDTFVLMQVGGILRPQRTLADIDQPYQYVPVSVGRSLSETFGQTFANEAVGLMPLSPVNVRVGLQGEDIIVSWDRRSRYEDNWLAGNVPLGEAVEAYEIDIESPSGAISTYEASSSPAALVLSSYQPVGLSVENGAAFRALELGGFVYALQGSTLVKMDATTLAVSASVTASLATMALVTDGTNLFTVGVGNPAVGTMGEVKKFNTSLTLLATQALDSLGDGASMVYCAGSLWVSLTYTGVVRRFNTSLGTIADVTTPAGSLSTDGALVYAIGTPDKCYIIDPATNTVTSSFDMDGRPLGVRAGNDAVVENGLLWAASSDDGLTVYSLANGLRYTHDIEANGALSAADGVVAIRNGDEVTLVSADTVLQTGSFTIPDDGFSTIPQVSVLSADRLIVFAGYNDTDYYERGELLPGSIVRVYQMSAAVGRGFPGEKEYT